MPTASEIPVEIGGKTYTLTTDDTYLRTTHGGFEPEMVRLYRAVGSGSDAILDIGANIGCTALLFADMAKTVHAFEPSRATFAFLETNIARAGCQNVVRHNFGLGAAPGEFTLAVDPSNRSGGFVSNHTTGGADHATEPIVIRQLDEVVDTLPAGKIDFIKIDVEGFEGQVLQGATRTLAAHHPVVVLELNHWCLNAFQRTSVPDFFDFLRARFPTLLAVDGQQYLNLHDGKDSFTVMYHHIIHRRFQNLLAATDDTRLAAFRAGYRYGFDPSIPSWRHDDGSMKSKVKRFVRKVLGRK